MSELRERLLDKRFLIEVCIAGAYALVNGALLGKFSTLLEKAASSPQAGKVLAVFVQYLIFAAFLVAIYAVEKREIKGALFAPFSVLLLLLTLKYMLKWFSLGASAFPGKIPALNSSLPLLEVMAFLNISYIPILLTSLQFAKIVRREKEKPFYALLLFNFTFIALYLFVVSPILVKNQAHLTTSLMVFYQFVFYALVYSLFAYTPYFVSNGDFWKETANSFGYALRHFVFVLIFASLLALIVYIVPFGIYSVGSNTNSYAVYASLKWGSVLFSVITYYFFPAYFIITAVKAKEDGQ